MRTKDLCNETLKEISRFLNVDIEQARKIKALVSYELSPDSFESVQSWVSQCYNEPRIDEKIMEALNEILGFYGIEALENPEKWISSYHGNIQFIYCNSGDCYHGTIIFDCENDKYFLGSIGDVIETLNIQ